MRTRWRHRAPAPPQWGYRGVVSAKNLAYERGLLRTRRLRWPVISIGNLSIGGAGKTPVVIALATLLQGSGLHVDVLSRGYGRRDVGKVGQVDPEGEADRFGDEPLLIARATHAPVFVASSRYDAGSAAEKSFAAVHGLHLLDDAFQHRKLARTVDIVVIHPADVHDSLLPSGRLREPVEALRRADFLVLRDDDLHSEAALRRAAIDKPVWRIRRSLQAPLLRGSVVAFCGIARPAEFFEGLRQQGIELQNVRAFRDHHAYLPADLEEILAMAAGASALLTTEKDYVRLSPAARALLQQRHALIAVPLCAEWVDAENVRRSLLERLGAATIALMRK